MRYLFAILLLSSCTTRPAYPDDFCYIYNVRDANKAVQSTLLVCSEKQPDGSFLNVDRPQAELKNYEGFVLIPVRVFEQTFGQ